MISSAITRSKNPRRNAGAPSLDLRATDTAPGLPSGTDRALSGSFLGLGHVGHVLAEGRRQVDLVFLLVDEDGPDLLGEGVLA
jgi:hypothetical protein